MFLAAHFKRKQSSMCTGEEGEDDKRREGVVRNAGRIKSTQTGRRLQCRRQKSNRAMISGTDRGTESVDQLRICRFCTDVQTSKIWRARKNTIADIDSHTQNSASKQVWHTVAKWFPSDVMITVIQKISIEAFYQIYLPFSSSLGL